MPPQWSDSELSDAPSAVDEAPVISSMTTVRLSPVDDDEPHKSRTPAIDPLPNGAESSKAAEPRKRVTPMPVAEPSRRSGRGSAKARRVDHDTSECEPDSEPDFMPTPKRLPNGKSGAQRESSRIPKARAAKRAKQDIWSKEYVLQNPESPIAGIDLKALLANPMAWDLLKKEQQEKLLSMFPEHQAMVIEPESSNPRPDSRFLRSNTTWAHYIARAQEDISEGRNDPEWLQQALDAHRDREAGKFDNWKDKEYEEFWGQKQKLAAGVVAGSTAGLKIKDLYQAGCIKVGDTFSYARSFKGTAKGKGVLVEKEAILGAYDVEKSEMRFQIPPAQQKFTKGDLDEVVDGITGPEALGKECVRIDGRLDQNNLPNGNSWKVIRVVRNNQDLGTIWDIRQALAFRIEEQEAQQKAQAEANGTGGRRTRGKPRKR